MRIFNTIFLVVLSIISVTLAVFLTVDGNLARITGWYRFEPGMPLFSQENTSRLGEVCWMRIEDMHDTIECERDEQGNWWIIKPFRDRLSPGVAQAILAFTAKARLVDTLPLNKLTRSNMREFGVETAPHRITLKTRVDEDRMTTIARYTLGSTSPWLDDAGDGETLLPTTYLRTNFYGRDKRIHVVSGNILDLFKDGLEALRDSNPLQINPEQLLSISIKTQGTESVELNRLSAEAKWNITAPIITSADEDNVSKLVQSLVNLKAVRVEDAPSTPLSEQPLHQISLKGSWGDTPIQLNIYEQYTTPGDEQVYCYATVSNRPVYFILQADRRISRKGSYARLINAICELPVLPDKAMAQVRISNQHVYTNELPLTVSALRSMQFTELDAKDIARVSLRATYDRNAAVRLMLIPGDKESQVPDTWMFATPGHRYTKAEDSIVQSFLKGLSNIPVLEIVADAAPGASMEGQMKQFGLNTPDYVLSILPKPCMVRATLFGEDLPLVKDRMPHTFLLRYTAHPQTGKRAWFGMEAGGNSICRLSTKFTKLLSLRAEKWKERTLLSFPISAVRRICFHFQQAPLVLDYDYRGESWTGTLGGEDVTPRINPHRAEYYVRSLQKLKVSQWLDAGDSDALVALQNPAFAVSLELEQTDYSDAESAVIEQQDDVNHHTTVMEDSGQSMLLEDSEDAALFRNLATAERKTIKEIRTIEIAPAAMDSDKPFFYGRVRETNQLFILPFERAQSLAGDLLDI